MSKGESFIGGAWVRGKGAVFSRRDPTEGRVVWEAAASSREQVTEAIGAANGAANGAAGAWARLTSGERDRYLSAFGEAVGRHSEELLQAICVETGKPRWESRTEVDAVKKKIELTRQAFAERLKVVESESAGVKSALRYKPLGTVAVLGPFNLPAHLPNGQIIPALLAGNTVVFKPSELTPHVGKIYAQCWAEANLPAGVFNMIHGGREQGAFLAMHSQVNGVYFTGSYAGGVALSTALAPHPEKILALEMGGNTPLVVAGVKDVGAAAYAIIQSAFITAGQRCTCARRLILIDAEAERILDRLREMSQKIFVGPYMVTPEPFMGPVISDVAAQRLLDAQTEMVSQGGTAVLGMKSVGRLPMLSPGIVDVTAVKGRRDEEFFGPLLQVIRVADFEAALVEANNTRFGLAAGLLSDDRGLYERFFAAVQAGIINWNRPTTGASGSLPFGGMKASGNHRPAGYFAVDFCADPVASMESAELALPKALSPGITV